MKHPSKKPTSHIILHHGAWMLIWAGTLTVGCGGVGRITGGGTGDATSSDTQGSTNHTGDADSPGNSAIGAPCSPAQDCIGDTICISGTCESTAIQCGDGEQQEWEECDNGAANSDTGACT